MEEALLRVESARRPGSTRRPSRGCRLLDPDVADEVEDGRVVLPRGLEERLVLGDRLVVAPLLEELGGLPLDVELGHWTPPGPAGKWARRRSGGRCRNRAAEPGFRSAPGLLRAADRGRNGRKPARDADPAGRRRARRGAQAGGRRRADGRRRPPSRLTTVRTWFVPNRYGTTR